jgi:hypothetical protein
MTVILIVCHTWSDQVLLEPPLIVGPIEHSSSIHTAVFSSWGDGVGCVLSTVVTAAHSRYLYYHPTELVTEHSIAAVQHLLYHITATLMVFIMMLLT